MTKYNCDINEELRRNTANAFLNVGIYCNKYDKQIQTESILFSCDAFELYLKALIVRETNKPAIGHDLAALYDQIPPSIRNVVENQFKNKCKYPVSLSETLEIHKKAFENWRYIFEGKNKESEAYPDNLILAAEVLRDELNRNKN